jgi:biotin carboxylase
MSGTPGTAVRPTLLVVGSGNRNYREYVLRAAAREHRLWLVQPDPVTWQAPHLAGHSTVDTSDSAAVAAVAADQQVAGILCYDEMRVEQAAAAAHALGLPGPAPEAVAACRDKWRTRKLLDTAGLGVRSMAVHDQASATSAAAGIGYPVVVKPRNQGASRGVRLVSRPDDLAPAVSAALAETWPGIPTPQRPVLVEEYLDGPEVSVDSLVYRGAVTPVVIARKRVGYPPAFEEIGHDLDAADPLFEDCRLRDVLSRAHAALGFDHGVTHTELRLTPAGPRVVEVNARLGGDLIPYAGMLATGIDMAAATARLTRGVFTNPRRRHAGHAAIRFLYPDTDCSVAAVHVDRSALPPQIRFASPVAEPGELLRLPPRGFAERYAVLIAAGDRPDRLEHALDRGAACVRLEVQPGR